MNIRPVRLAPWAAGARPTTSRRASGSPKPGTPRAQYSSSRKAARFSRPTRSRHSTSRGHARHSATSEATSARMRREPGDSTDDQATLACTMATRSARTAAKPASKSGTEAAAVVLFVRHGQTPTTGSVLPGRAPGLHLSPEGAEQARRAAERLAALDRVKAVYASPMERTVETAAPIARACKLRVRRSPGLIECDFGRWTGRKLQNLRRRKEWTTVQRHPSGFRFPGGESFAEMQARALDAVAAICALPRRAAICAATQARLWWPCPTPM